MTIEADGDKMCGHYSFISLLILYVSIDFEYEDVGVLRKTFEADVARYLLFLTRPFSINLRFLLSISVNDELYGHVILRNFSFIGKRGQREKQSPLFSTFSPLIRTTRTCMYTSRSDWWVFLYYHLSSLLFSFPFFQFQPSHHHF